jgi:hypothetical protein
MTQAGETLAAAEEDGQNAVDALRIVRYGRTHTAGGQSRSLTDEGSREVVEAQRRRVAHQAALRRRHGGDDRPAPPVRRVQVAVAFKNGVVAVGTAPTSRIVRVARADAKNATRLAARMRSAAYSACSPVSLPG